MGPLPTLAVLPPITASEVRKAPQEINARWWAHWAHWTVEALRDSPHSPLREGVWLLESIDRAEPHHIQEIDPERGVIQDSMCGLFVSLSEPDAERTKVWRKRARRHPVPPCISLVLGWAPGGDIDVVLDGHCRLFGRRFLQLIRLDDENGGVPLDVPAWDHEVRRELERRGEDPAKSELLMPS